MNKVKTGKVQKKSKTKPPQGNKEIDDIFAIKPSKKQPPPPKTPIEPSVKVIDATKDFTINQQQKPPPKKDDNFADSRGTNSKYTEDGLRVFYMEDLKIGQGEGDTELCPFDCDCCF